MALPCLCLVSKIVRRENVVLSIRVSGNDNSIVTHLSMHRSYLFSRVHPVRCCPSVLLWSGSFISSVKTPHINVLAGAMQTSGQFNVNFPFMLTCQKPQTGGCKLCVCLCVVNKAEGQIAFYTLLVSWPFISAWGTALWGWQQHDEMAAFRTTSEKHGVIYLGSLFVVLNKAFRDQGVKNK